MDTSPEYTPEEAEAALLAVQGRYLEARERARRAELDLTARRNDLLAAQCGARYTPREGFQAWCTLARGHRGNVHGRHPGLPE